MDSDREGLCTIGEAAGITGVPTKTIRYYADLGLLPPTGRSKGGYRLFSVGDLWRLELVRTLRDLDFGLDEIGELLGGEVPTSVAVELQRQAVELRRRQLGRTEALLERAQSDLDDPEDPDAVEVLRGLTATFAEEAEERRRFVGRAAATLTELRALAATEQRIAALWEDLADRGVDPERFIAELTVIGERAGVLARAGTAPDDPEAQELCSAWLRLLLGDDPSPDRISELAEQAPAWVAADGATGSPDRRSIRRGARGPGERLLLDALDRRVRR